MTNEDAQFLAAQSRREAEAQTNTARLIESLPFISALQRAAGEPSDLREARRGFRRASNVVPFRRMPRKPQ